MHATAAPTLAKPAHVVTANDVVERYYGAVGAHQWALAWQLGGRNFGQAYADFVNGYGHTTREVLTIDIAGDTGSRVPVHLLAYTDTGLVQLFGGAYTVQGGTVVSGQLSEQFSESAAVFQATSVREQLADLGYTPDSAIAQVTGAGLNAVPATCTNTGDGRCQKVFFYEGPVLVGVDTPVPDTAVSVAWLAGNKAALVYPQYAAGDPMCCPSGNAVTVEFSWQADRVGPLTPLPNPINGQ